MLKLFHISDCHIDKEIVPESRKFIEGLNGHNIEVWGAFQKHFMERKKEAGNNYLAVFTGDISAQGSIDSLRLAKSFIVKDDSEISKKLGLQIPKENLFIISGNHDSYNDRLLGPNSLKNFKEIFDITEFFPLTHNFIHNGNSFSIIGFDSAYLRPSISVVKKLGRGVIEKNQYRLAEGFLRERKSDFIIVCLHHNPIFPPHIRKDWSLILEESDYFVKWLVKNKIDLVLFGHIHDDFYDAFPLHSIIKFLPNSSKNIGAKLRRLFLKTNVLMDYKQLSIKGKYLRQLDSIAYQYATLKRKEDKEKDSLLKPGNFKSKEQLEKYIQNIPEYKEFIEDLNNFSKQKTTMIMSGSICQHNSKRKNSYIELDIPNDFEYIKIYRHKYTVTGFETKVTKLNLKNNNQLKISFSE